MLAWIDAALPELGDLFAAGGMIMLPLMMLCLLMWLLITERILFFRRLNRQGIDQRAVWDHIRTEREPDPRQYGGVMALVVAEFTRRRGTNRAMDRMILEETLMTLKRRLTARLAMIGVLVAIAPLLGLLGTVTGMMTTFDVLAIFGTGNAKAMADGISEALITTQTGLLVAIPGLVMKVLLDRQAHGLRQTFSAAGYYLGRHLDGHERPNS